ncbi:uncharacterized protein LOC121735062 [Aricia agestis]|uniref:uncharacterized protein LOC121735062 n=1 Tax=Aricia agestis TaxID=91739 RepID=UPI001C20165A|nr:uncharacterized protein LOC121735062 [Aricia agestis]
MCTVCAVSCSQASGSQEQLTTTLYPVNKTFDLRQQETNLFHKHTRKENNHVQPILEEQQKNKIDTKSDLNQPNEGMTELSKEKPKNKDTEQNENTEESEEIAISDNQKDDEQKSHVKSNTGVKNEVTTWSLETNYSQDEKDSEKDFKEEQKKVIKEFKEEQKKIIKEFRPSPHLGSFYDEDAFALTTQASVVPWSPYTKPPGFIRSPQDFYKLNYKKPIDAPYKFETAVYPDPTYWKHGLESKPTDPVPVRTPAGGLYRSPDVFKDTSQEYGLYKEEGKATSHKKAVSPWKSFLQLASALLPVGLIVSALTPSVITLQSTDNTPYYGNRITRRVEGLKPLPVISESCKRRLLCELHAPRHSNQTPTTGHKHCYKLQCEDPAAMMTVLRFLLTHRPPGTPAGSPPGGVIPLG